MVADITGMPATHHSAAWVAYEPAPEGIHGELETIGEAKLGQDRGEMISYRRLADEEPFGNRAVLEPLADEGNDLALPGCQRPDFVGLGVARTAASGNAGQHTCGDRAIQPDLSTVNFSDRLDQDLWPLILQHQSCRPKFDQQVVIGGS